MRSHKIILLQNWAPDNYQKIQNLRLKDLISMKYTLFQQKPRPNSNKKLFVNESIFHLSFLANLKDFQNKLLNSQQAV